MSSPEVRTAFRDAWDSYAPGIPYVDAINRHPGPLPATFGSLGFQVDSRRDVTMGSEPWVVETGTVLVSFFAPAGEDDTTAVAAAQHAAVWLLGRSFAPDIFITGIVGPNDAADEGDGEYFETQVAVSYESQGREARTQEG